MLTEERTFCGCSAAASNADETSGQTVQENSESEPVQAKGQIACHICGRVFKRSNHLTQHLRSHSGLCSSAFSPLL